MYLLSHRVDNKIYNIEMFEIRILFFILCYIQNIICFLAT